MESLEQLLFGAAETLKMDFQLRITQIVVTPVEDDKGRFFRIMGDVGLFSAPESAEQTNQVYSFGLHYKIPVCCIVQRQNRREVQVPVERMAA